MERHPTTPKGAKQTDGKTGQGPRNNTGSGSTKQPSFL